MPDRAIPAPAVPPNRLDIPVTWIRGAHPGPTVALVAGVHGGKVAAVRATEELAGTLGQLQGELRGTVVLVHVANVAGYRAGLAQLNPEDSLNLNRVFPGRADGRPTERLAHWLMTEIVAKSDYLVDLHGSDGDEGVGAFAYAARPGLDARVDSAALRLARAWGTPRVVWDDAGPRTLETSRFLQTAAHLSGVPAITVFEAGAAREDSAATAAFVRGATRLLASVGVLMRETGDLPAPLVHSRREVTLADSTGRWVPGTGVRPGAPVRAGEPLGMLVRSSGVPVQVVSTSGGVVLHQRLAGQVQAGTALVILAAGVGSTIRH